MKETQTGSMGQKSEDLLSHLDDKLVEELIGNVAPISWLELRSHCPRAVPVKWQAEKSGARKGKCKRELGRVRKILE